MSRVRVRPSKPASAMGMIVGLVMVGVGFVWVVPTFGPFGILWTLVAAAIAIFHAVNVFSTRGMAMTEIDIEGDRLVSQKSDGLPFDDRLRRLEQLRAEGLINDQEFQQKRAEMLGENW